MKKLLVVISIIMLLTNCSNIVEQTLDGTWSIDTVVYKGYNMRFCIPGNLIKFDGKTIEFPITQNYCQDVIITYDDKGTWKLYHTDSIALGIEIVTKNEMFAGNHKIKFKKDEQNKLLKMEISSDSLYIVCRKGLFSYDYNIRTIDQLIKMSE